MSEARGLLALLEGHAEQRPFYTAIREVDGGVGRRLGWRDLLEICEAVAARLGPFASLGPVVVSARNSVELLAALVGGIASGAEVLPAPPDAGDSELEGLLGSAGAAGFAASSDGPRPAMRPGTRWLDLSELVAPTAGRPPEATDSEGAVLLPTSGTTGERKLVRRSERALIAVGVASTAGFGLGQDDRILLSIPLCHSYGIDQAMAALVSGCGLDLHRRFDPSSVRRAILEDGITTLPAVPVMLDSLLRSSKPGEAPGLRRVISAGSPLPLRIFEGFQQVSGVSIGQLYGSTEFGSVTYNDPSAAGFDPMSVGRPLPGVEIRIVAEQKPDPERPLPAGCEGLVAVASPTLFDGYLDDREIGPKGGFFVTGDLGVLDERGSLRLTGRAALLVDVGGRKVNLLEVEAVLESHPGVGEAVVVAMRQTDTVARLKAILVPKPGASLDRDDLHRFACKHLAPHKVPRAWDVRVDVPRSSTGKILRTQLVSNAENSIP